VAGDAVGREQHQRVGDQDEHEPGEKHQRQSKSREDRRHDRVQDGDRGCGGQRAAEVVDGRTGDDPGRDK